MKDRRITSMVRAVSKQHVHIIELKSLQTTFGSLDDAERVGLALRNHNINYTYCLRERPVSLGVPFGPQKSFVVMTRSVRLHPSSLMTRPLKAYSVKSIWSAFPAIDATLTSQLHIGPWHTPQQYQT